MVELKALTMVKMQNKKSEAEFYELLIQSQASKPEKSPLTFSNQLSECISHSLTVFFKTENPLKSGNILPEFYSLSFYKLLEAVLMWIEPNDWVITHMRN